jgi:hypothetical protein
MILANVTKVIVGRWTFVVTAAMPGSVILRMLGAKEAILRCPCCCSRASASHAEEPVCASSAKGVGRPLQWGPSDASGLL